MPVAVAARAQVEDCHSLAAVAERYSVVEYCCAAAYDCSAGTDLLENLCQIDEVDHLVGLEIDAEGHFA
jgi:hypothetical protein